MSARGKGKKGGGGGSAFWKLAAALLCVIQVFQYTFVHNPVWFGRRPEEHAPVRAGGTDARPTLSLGSSPRAVGGSLYLPGGSGSEAEINRLHRKLQVVCGHRGIPAGDKHHIDSRKGPTAEVMQLLSELEAAYERKRAAGTAFDGSGSQERDGTALWRRWEFSCFSQCGDDGLLYRIFGILGWGLRRSVEIGYFPHEANSVNLLVNANFTGLLLDGNTDPLIARSWYSSVGNYLEMLHENHRLPLAEQTFKEPTETELRSACAPYCLRACYNVNCYKGSVMAREPMMTRDLVKLTNIQHLIDSPFAALGISVRGARGLDYFSIDIDGMDYYLLDSLLSNGYAPRVVATEYAAHMGKDLAVTRPYSPTFAAAATSFQYGASLMAFLKLMRRHDYRFIGCVEWNAYFIRNDELRRPEHSRAFPEPTTATCFYQDAASRTTEVVRRRKACQVEWVEVEVDAGSKAREWPELKDILLSSLDPV